MCSHFACVSAERNPINSLRKFRASLHSVVKIDFMECKEVWRGSKAYATGNTNARSLTELIFEFFYIKKYFQEIHLSQKMLRKWRIGFVIFILVDDEQ